MPGGNPSETSPCHGAHCVCPCRSPGGPVPGRLRAPELCHACVQGLPGPGLEPRGGRALPQLPALCRLLQRYVYYRIVMTTTITLLYSTFLALKVTSQKKKNVHGSTICKHTSIQTYIPTYTGAISGGGTRFLAPPKIRLGVKKPVNIESEPAPFRCLSHKIKQM